MFIFTAKIADGRRSFVMYLRIEIEKFHFSFGHFIKIADRLGCLTCNVYTCHKNPDVGFTILSTSRNLALVLGKIFGLEWIFVFSQHFHCIFRNIFDFPLSPLLNVAKTVKVFQTKTTL